MKTLQTKFIEGTNEQYSIREDGAVISHYRLRSLNGKLKLIVKDIIRKQTSDHRCNILNVSVSTISLLYTYFNYYVCKQCNKKVYEKPSKRVCKTCIKHNRKVAFNNRLLLNKQVFLDKRKEHRSKNPDKYKEFYKKIVENVPKHYVANNLGLKTSELSDDLYKHVKQTLFFKRQLSKEHGIPIRSLHLNL